jgi:hypothetical protein
MEALNPVAFQTWLEEKHPNETVGEPLKRCSCPLANFFKEATGAHKVSVSGNSVYIYDVDQRWMRVIAPYWIWKFVKHVDGSEVQELHAAAALDFLESAVERGLDYLAYRHCAYEGTLTGTIGHPY